MRRVLAYVWASPNTALGLVAALVTSIPGGRSRWVDGVLECSGPGRREILRRLPLVAGGAAAVTLGHVVLGTSSAVLEQTRAHERVHVQQYERWGPFFLPTYFLSSLLCLVWGGNPYLDNPFEKEAFRRGG